MGPFLPLTPRVIQSAGCTLTTLGSLTTISCNKSFSPLTADESPIPPQRASATSYLAAEITIPAESSYLVFDYQFSNSKEGDYAAVFIDDKLVWMLSASSANASATSDSGPIPVNGLKGPRRLTLVLFGDNPVTFGFELRNLSTFAVSTVGTPNQNEITQFVPIVLSSAGLNNSFFTSELTLTNRGATQATVSFTYTSAFGSGDGTATFTLEPGRQRVVPDAISFLIALGVPIPATGNRGGTLSVRFSGLTSLSDAAVTVRTTTQASNGRAGLAYAGIPASAALNETAYLFGLRQNSQDRSNVAIQHAGSLADGGIVVRLTVFSGDPSSPSSKVLAEEALPPGGFRQISEILRAEGLSLTNGYVRVERIAGSARFYAYGVINDQSTSDGSFISPIPESSLQGKTGLTLPVIVEGGGFSSERVLTNWSSTRKTVNFNFVAEAVQSSSKGVAFSRTLGAGEQVIVPNFVQFLRDSGLSSQLPLGQTYVGSLFATVDGGDVSGIGLAARTAAPGGGGQFGLFYPAVPYGAASTGTAWLYGLQQNSENRSNLALVNTGEVDAGPNVFRIELFDGDSGTKVGTIDGVTVNARRWHQIGSILAQHAPGVRQGYAKVTRVSGFNPFIAYAVINDGGQPGERTGDGAFVSSSP